MTCERLRFVARRDCEQKGGHVHASLLCLWISCLLGPWALQGCGGSSAGDKPRGQCAATSRTKVSGRTDLPRGACEDVDEACELSTRDDCADGASGPLETWRCICQDEIWKCTVTARSLTVCLDENDAGGGAGDSSS
jgi:hypothetical protein